MDDLDARERLRAASEMIATQVAQELPGWVTRSVDGIVAAWDRLDPDQVLRARAEAERLAPAVAERVTNELRLMFALDPADQASTPLQIVRSAVREPTALLRELGIPEVVRDPFDERANPEDGYDLVPRTLADLGNPELGPVLLEWGIAKSHVLRARLG